MAMPDPEDVNIDQPIIPATGLIFAPTSGVEKDVKRMAHGPRPRALLMSWTPDDNNPGFGTIGVVFRDAGGRVYNYYDVPQDIWVGFESTYSTGEYLESSGLNGWPNKGFAEGASTSYQKVVSARRKEFGGQYATTKGFLGAPKKLLGKRPTQ